MIYLDNAATSFPKPESVYRAMDECARTSLGNPGRSGHRMAVESERSVARGRQLLCELLHGEHPDRFVFTLNGTDSLNMAVKGVLRSGDHVVTGVLEHNSLRRPLRRLEADGVISLTMVGCDRDGFYRVDEVAAAIGPQTRLVALSHASNVFGTIQPIKEIGRLCRERDVLFLVDAAQSAGVLHMNLNRLPIDLWCAPGHKSLYGPTGVGVLYVGPRAEIGPWREGGTGRDSGDDLHPTRLPHSLEAGTPNVLGIVGLSAGIQAILEADPVTILEKERRWADQLRRELREINGVRLYGPVDGSDTVGIVAFAADWLEPMNLGAILDEAFQIAVRPGLHCSPTAHQAMGTFPDGLVRVSFGQFNGQQDVERFVEAIATIAGEVA